MRRLGKSIAGACALALWCAGGWAQSVATAPTGGVNTSGSGIVAVRESDGAIEFTNLPGAARQALGVPAVPDSSRLRQPPSVMTEAERPSVSAARPAEMRRPAVWASIRRESPRPPARKAAVTVTAHAHPARPATVRVEHFRPPARLARAGARPAAARRRPVQILAATPPPRATPVRILAARAPRFFATAARPRPEPVDSVGLPTGIISVAAAQPPAVPSRRPVETSPSPVAAPSSVPSRAAPVLELLNAAARRYSLDPRLMLEVARQESDFDPRSVSDKGALGVMQLMPETARELGVTDPFNAAENIDGGARYLRDLLRQYRGDVRLSLAAYNAGPAAVAQYGNRVPPFAETRGYVRAITRRLRRDHLRRAPVRAARIVFVGRDAAGSLVYTDAQ